MAFQRQRSQYSSASANPPNLHTKDLEASLPTSRTTISTGGGVLVAERLVAESWTGLRDAVFKSSVEPQAVVAIAVGGNSR